MNVYLHITSYQGLAVGAIHYYGNLIAQDAPSVELKQRLTLAMATARNKQEGRAMYREGYPTYGFDTEAEIIALAIATYRTHFPAATRLLLGHPIRASHRSALRRCGGPMSTTVVCHICGRACARSFYSSHWRACWRRRAHAVLTDYPVARKRFGRAHAVYANGGPADGSLHGFATLCGLPIDVSEGWVEVISPGLRIVECKRCIRSLQGREGR